MTVPYTSYYLVIGLGTSGLSMARFLRSQGREVVVTDIDGSKSAPAEELKASGIHCEIGFHEPETFRKAGVMVPSPGIPLSLPPIRTAMEQGVPVMGELDIFAAHNTLPVVAITGTNGKTTTTTLIGDILRACGKTPFVGGNIGTPLVEHLMAPGTSDVIVAEISSFQLDLSTRFRPDVGVLLNISDDHLDRYGSIEAYEASKWSLFKHQRSSDAAVINRSMGSFDRYAKHLCSRTFVFSSQTSAPEDCHAVITDQAIRIRVDGYTHSLSTHDLTELKGVHNHENTASAILACLALGGCDFPDIATGVHTFTNLPHRVEFVRTLNGVSFYDDSKGTNTDAVIRALGCFKEPVVLILGGREKGTDFSLLIPDVRKRVKALVSIGESRPHVRTVFQGLCPITEADTMSEAVTRAFAAAASGDVVLLSPACASFDMYRNYGHRGDEFKTCVHSLEMAGHD